MPLHVRSIAISFAVIAFFAISLIGLVNKLSPLTCSKRAITGAIVVYLVADLAVKAINAILLSAMITKKVDQQKENVDDS